MALTKRQKQVLDFIAGFVDENGYCPSYDEIAKGLNLASLATVHKHISVLETKSYLKRGFNQSRSLELSAKYVQEQRRTTKSPLPDIPLMGRIAAGVPVESVEQREMLNFSDFAGNAHTFALEVRGDSMSDDHICDGDVILLEKAAEVRDGDIVVALVAGSETTLKRIYREPADTIRLQPANSTLKPMYYPAAEVQIQGRLLAVLRKYK
jgi:repressor LexA